MERYKVSGQELRHFYDSNISLGRVFSDIEEDLRTTDQVVCRYVINGLEIADYEEAKFSSVTLDQIETLEYVTEDTNDLTRLVLAGWIDAIPELMQATENLAKRMRKQGLSGILRSIHELVQNCEYLIDSTISLRSFLTKEQQSQIGVSWEQAQEHSKKTVSEALQALEQKNFIQLADVLEYDLNQMLHLWTQQLKHMETLLNGQQPGTRALSEQTRPHFMGRKRASC